MQKSESINWLSWLFLLLNLFSIYLITQIEDYSLWFLLFLGFNIAFGFLASNKINKSVLFVSRILVGLLFIYSGLVKGVDPLGTQFRIEDYFYAYGIIWALPFALGLSIIMNAFEFSIGALLITKIKAKWITTLALLMMLFFTATTVYDAIANPVPDCGCFGDALIISNWQTLYKNLVINAFVLLLFFRRKEIKIEWKNSIQFVTLIAIIAGFVSFEFYNIKHLPVMDFRPLKVGNRLLPENPLPVKFYLTYKKTATGEEKEFLSNELPWQDSVFMADWAWSSSREEDPNIDEERTFPMVDAEGEDWSSALVSSESGILFFVIYDIAVITPQQAQEINRVYNVASEAGLEMIILNSNTTQVYQEYREKLALPDMEVYNSDDTSLKAAIRSNPGLILIQDATVIAKYHINDFPNIEDIKELLK